MTNNVSSTSKKHILACIDGSNVTQSVCDYAGWYGSNLNLPVSILHMLDVPKSNRHDLSGAIGMDSRRYLQQKLTKIDEEQARIANKHGEALVRDAKQHINNLFPDLKVRTHLRRGKLVVGIEHFIDDARVIILGRRGQDHQNNHMNIGSQIESIVRSVSRPILVCSDAYKTPDSFLIAFDGSATAKKAVNILCQSHVSRNLKGFIVMVGHEDTKLENDLYAAQSQMKKAGISATAHVINANNYDNDVVTALTEFRKDNNISIFVMGAYGNSKFKQFFVGSTTTKMLTKTTAPVLLLR